MVSLLIHGQTILAEIFRSGKVATRCRVRDSQKEHWTGFLKRQRTSVLEMLISIPAMSHAPAKRFNAFWSPDFEEIKELNY